MGLFGRSGRSTEPRYPLIVALQGLLLPHVKAQAPYWNTFKIQGDERWLRAALAARTQVVVAFRLPDGRLHPEGVLADITGEAPFEKDIDTSGLGASQRYTFEARRRCRLPDSVIRAAQPLPSVVVETLAENPEDSVKMPVEIEDRYRILAENGAGWMQRYELCRGRTLGYWILYALQGEPDPAWLTTPSLVIDQVKLLVDRMVPRIDPISRRAAISAEVAPRYPTQLPERTVLVGTDIAMWVLFHPLQLEESGLPTNASMLLDDAEMRRRFKLGLLVAVGTGNDGTYAVRFTAGELTADEKRHARKSCDFPLRVSHGRLFLWGEPIDDLDDAELGINPDSWIDVPNGCYLARVTAIEGSAERPDYVVQLEPRDSPCEAPDRLPLLEPY
jgi:hypothetical protein